jgi:plasmid stability protein
LEPECNLFETDMPVNITIKGIPDDLHRKLKESAARNRRSLNSEILMKIEQGLRVPMLPEPRTASREAADELRDVYRYSITNDDIDAWKREGRE